MSLRQVQAALAKRGQHVDLTTLGYWRSGTALPTHERALRTLAVMEDILGLMSGALVSTLPGDVFSRWDPVRSLPFGEVVPRMMEVMGLQVDGHHNLYLHDHTEVADSHEHHDELLRAGIDDLSAIPVVVRQRVPGERPPTFWAGSGCHLSRVVQLDDAGLLCAEFRLPHSLARGELHMMEFAMNWEYPAGHADQGVTRLVREGLEYWVCTVDFDQRLPTSVSYRFGSRPDWDVAVEPPLHRQQLRPARSVQVTLRDPAPGIYTVDWTY